MEQVAARSLTNQLAEDLAWLEQHARSQPQHAAQAGELRYAAALVRNLIAPFLEGQPAMPLHVAVVGGAGFKRGTIVGKTNEDGTQVDSEPYTSQDLMASVLKSLGISLDTTFTSKSGRPMKIANSGKVIKELFV